jgi:hypothetical protein
MEDVRRLPMSADLVIDLMTGEPPPILNRLFLVVWMISGGIGATTPSQTDHSISSWQSGNDPQKSAMSARGSPSSILFHQASLKDVMDYLVHLYDRKLSWSTIGIHRSAISMTLAPIDGVLVGEHPIVKRLIGGVFSERPPCRDAPTLWDPQGF